MKFGSQLREALYGEWNEFYLDYDGLKKHLKRGETKEGGFSEKDENEFVERLDKELEKIYAFQNSKDEQIKNRVQQCKNDIESTSNVPSMKDKYAEVEREINEVTEELKELAKYARLNYTGIMKIIKKHDRRTRYILRPMFSVRLNACPFYKETFEPIVVQLSELYHIVHQGLGADHSTDERPSTPNFSALAASSSKKYWVHQDNIMEVKTTILRQLPVLIYKPGSSITSIYFDSESFELYQDKVDRKPGDQIIRLRWYGNKMNDISIERIIDEEKEKILIKEKYVNEFLKGNYSMDKTIKKMKEDPSKTEEDIQQFQKLIQEIQDTIKDKKLEPVLRTYFNRMAFQIPGDQHVRISLDTDFNMIREDNGHRGDNEWCRMDIDDNQFDKLPLSECVKFPYAVMEVKLKLDEGDQEPAWVKELVESHLVEEAPQFSKYVHGIATLFTSQAPSLPYWLPNIDKDILKPPSARQLQEEDYPEPSTSSAARPRRTMSGKVIVNVEVVGDRRDKKNKGKAVDYSIEEEAGDENTPLLGEEEEEEDEQQKPIGLKAFRKIFQGRKRSVPETVILPPNVRIPRKIITPMRVEPKVFFANERTFFSWMRFSVFLGTFSMALFNAGVDDGAEEIRKTCGLMYATISIIVLIYSLAKYNKRLTMINNRDPGPYDDIFAPPLVCLTLFVAIGVNFYLTHNRSDTSSKQFMFNMQSV